MQGQGFMAATSMKLLGEGGGAMGAADGDHAVFHGLAQHFEDGLAELRELIEKQDAAMAQGDLAGAHLPSAADEPRVRDGVMRRAEGPSPDERRVRRQEPADAVDLRDLQRVLRAHRRQDRRHGAGEERLAAAGRTGHEHVVAAGGSDLQGALDVVLALDVGEVGAVPDRLFGRKLRGTGDIRLDGLEAGEMGGKLGQRAHRHDSHAFDEGGLRRVGRRDVCGLQAALLRQRDHR
jgi:hypothetical protein